MRVIPPSNFWQESPHSNRLPKPCIFSDICVICFIITEPYYCNAQDPPGWMLFLGGHTTTTARLKKQPRLKKPWAAMGAGKSPHHHEDKTGSLVPC